MESPSSRFEPCEPARAEIACDVAVLGGGLAGLGVATCLARHGLAVVCLEPRPPSAAGTALAGRVGESLDWSSPQLLAELGFAPQGLLDAGLGTAKRHIHVTTPDGGTFEMGPPPWMGRRPWSLDLATLHLDRSRFDRELLEAAQRAGVDLRREPATRIHVDGQRVAAVETASALVRARRYVDASGRARLLGRAFSIPRVPTGLPKVSAWTYLPADPLSEGTTLYLDRWSDPLVWVWEIPLSAELLSVGLTLPAAELKRRLGPGTDLAALLREELRRHGRFEGLLASHPVAAVHAVSFQCYRHRRTSGPNWLLVGEAAAMVDPLTSNGFTFALRFGAHACELIERSLGRPSLPAAGRRVYDGCLQRIAQAFNTHIERAAYRPTLRAGLGTYRATWVYVVFGFLANALYQRLRPRGPAGALLLRALLAAFGLWLAAWTLLARCRLLLGPPPAGDAALAGPAGAGPGAAAPGESPRPLESAAGAGASAGADACR